MILGTRSLRDGTHVDVAKLEKISLKGLEAGDEGEAAKLLSAAQSIGMFHLDFQGSDSGNLLLHQIGEVYHASQRYFDQGEPSKLKDIRTDQKPSQDKGYKFCETDETFEMAYDELVKGDLILPDLLNSNLHTMKDFSEICHNAAVTMLQALSTTLSAEPSFEAHHRKSELSDSGLKLVFEPCIESASEVVENKHTDSGTLTILFYDEWGLHVQLPDGEWGYVEPISGCAVVNVADSLQKLSGGRLRSPVHRVTQPSDGFLKRYYLSYFLRPEYNWKEIQRCS
ncbi:hypothetical protein ABW19_dt0203432 [Dactylella cylindrospora]|nr:hypothetical protein ABW19_dt0203432 [Dactylella cylindrospora]